MAKRACDRKKDYKRTLRAQAVEGRVNDANGNFKSASATNTTDKHMLAGYKVGSYKRSRGR